MHTTTSFLQTHSTYVCTHTYKHGEPTTGLLWFFSLLDELWIPSSYILLSTSLLEHLSAPLPLPNLPVTCNSDLLPLKCSHPIHIYSSSAHLFPWGRCVSWPETENTLLSLDFNSLTKRCLSVVFFLFILLGVHWASWIWGLVSFIGFLATGDILSRYCFALNISSVSFSLSPFFLGVLLCLYWGLVSMSHMAVMLFFCIFFFCK